MSDLRFVTLNINGIGSNPANHHHDLDLVAPHADVLCLQECWGTKIRDFLPDDFSVYQTFEDQGQGLSGHGAAGPVLAFRKDRVQINDKGLRLLVRASDMSDRYVIWAKVTVDGHKDMMIANVHMPPNEKGYREKYYPTAATELTDWVRNHKDLPMVIGGDWNFQFNRHPNQLDLMPRMPKGYQIDGYGLDGFVTSAHINNNDMGQYTNVRTDHKRAVYLHIGVGSSDPKDPGGGRPPKREYKMRLKFVSSNIYTVLSEAKAKEDAMWIVNNFDPDVWVAQETNHHTATLRAIKGYGIAKSDIQQIHAQEHSVLWKQDQWKLVGNRTWKLADLPGYYPIYLFMAHLVPRKDFDAPSLHVFSMHTYPHVQTHGTGGPRQFSPGRIEQAHNYFEKASKIIEQYAGKDSVVLWGGDLNVDADSDKGQYPMFPEASFKKHDLIPIYDELDTSNSRGTLGFRKVDYVGTHKADKGVKALNFRVSPSSVNSDHQYVLGIYELKGFGAESGGTGNPSEPGDPDPKCLDSDSSQTQDTTLT